MKKIAIEIKAEDLVIRDKTHLDQQIKYPHKVFESKKNYKRSIFKKDTRNIVMENIY